MHKILDLKKKNLRAALKKNVIYLRSREKNTSSAFAILGGTLTMIGHIPGVRR